MPGIKTLIRKILREINPKKPSFENSSTYWEDRYRTGGKSGSGSYSELARFKADIINEFIRTHGVDSVIEHGCGDGNQLHYASYESYVGFDISPEAIAICKKKYRNDPSRIFRTNAEYDGETAALGLSLDVIYHLVEDEVFADYMQRLFRSATDFVIIYSSDFDAQDGTMAHVRHREFTRYVAAAFPAWELIEKIPNRYPYREDGSGSHADFFIYAKKDGQAS